MEKSELQKPILQLFNALKSHFLYLNFFQIIGCSKQLKKSHDFSKIIFCDIITSELYSPDVSCWQICVNRDRLVISCHWMI